ncbi:MAG: gliding motility-associated C-terminal domain-containing protein [Flavobacteriales bacterium]|nr:gliding motility-associated C-terminal domain-containing protein [Flavobacteriales bacterium]
MVTRLLFAGFVSFISSCMMGQTYFLNGTATAIGNDCYRLTQNINTQNGSVWYADQINLNEPFNIEFDIYLGLNDAGADGIVFVLQTVGTNALGTSGGGLGYEGFLPSLGIEFDTWQNTNNGDPFYDHIAVISDGNLNHNAGTNIAGPIQASLGSANVEDGQYHQVNINWDPATLNLIVLFDCDERINTTYNIVSNVFSGDPVVYWGFTGSTGGANNNQIVCLAENILSVGPNVTICTGASTVLDIPGDPEGVFEWSPATGLDDPTSGSPVASPDTTTTYVVTYNNLCGSILSDSVTVTVQDLEVAITESPLLSCESPVQNVTAENNFDNSINYTWTTDTGIFTGSNTVSSPAVEAPGWYFVTADYDSVCFAMDSVYIDGDYVFNAEVVISDILSCYEPEATLMATANPSNSVDYNWDTSTGGIVSGQGTDEIVVSEPGNYTLTAYINDFCQEQITVNVEANFEVTSAEAGPDQQLDCDTPQLNLQGSAGGTGVNILWNTSNGNLVAGITSFTPLVNEPGTYTITITNQGSGCTDTDQVTVVENYDPPLAEAGISDTLTCQHPSTQIIGAAYGGQDPEFSWSTLDGNIVEGGNTLSPTVNQPGTYIISVVDNFNGCISTDAVEIYVNEDFFLDISSLTMPNVVTPNNDGQNDIFTPFLSSDPEFDISAIIQEYSLLVFDRWGLKVHESEPSDRYWDGLSNGFELSDGTYYYIIEFRIDCDVQETHQSQGHIEIIH